MPPALHFDGRIVALHEGITRIGRSITADIELENITVSRRHALVVHEHGETILLDDGSRNGIWLNGARVARAVLHDGDTIVLGTAELRYAEAALIAA
jgi:pSer/pThr/pTyr-binding forkhead associated (FHA) protein